MHQGYEIEYLEEYQEGGNVKKVTKEEFNSSLQKGYKPINNNTAVKNVIFENKLQAAAINMATQTQQQQAQYNQWLAEQMKSGKASPEYLAQQGYGKLEQLKAMYASLRPASDTIYYDNNSQTSSLNKKSGATFFPNGGFNYFTGNTNIKGMIQNDTLFFLPGTHSKHDMETAALIARDTYGKKPIYAERNYTSDAVQHKQKGGVIVDPMGQYTNPGEEVIIPSGRITMKNVPYNVLGIDNLGNVQLMKPEGEYQFPGEEVYEIPLKNLKRKRKNG